MYTLFVEQFCVSVKEGSSFKYEGHPKGVAGKPGSASNLTQYDDMASCGIMSCQMS